MDDSKFLITGAGGQVGLALRQKYPNAQAKNAEELDITNPESIKNYDWSNVSTILNAAAYTDVDGAETNEGRLSAWKVNAQAVAYLAKAAREHNITLIHISTDYVFDGTQNPHKEDEPLSPLGVYAAAKAAGDIAAGSAPKHYILRSSWVVGEGKNFVRTMLGLGQKGINPTVVSDQIGRPTFTSVLVQAVDHLLNSQAEYGVYNVTNGGEPVSWSNLTRAIFHEANLPNQVTDTITAAYYADKPQAAPRPLNSVMDLAKIEATGFKAAEWQADLASYVKKELAK